MHQNILPFQVPSQRVRKTFSPDVRIDTANVERGEIFIVRDDILPGGTKQRACGPLLEQLVLQGYSEFVYASPFCGFAQVALAHVCQELGFSCTVFTEDDPSAASGQPHEFTKLARSFGATAHLSKNLTAAEAAASAYAAQAPERFKIPLGFDCDEFKKAFEAALEMQWMIIQQKLGRTPKRIWLPIGSGTLASVFAKVVGADVDINCVNVHVLPKEDLRIQALNGNPRFRIFNAPEKFPEHAMKKPNVPSNTHYDAKIWRFLLENAEAGDLWWNVAR